MNLALMSGGDFDENRLYTSELFRFFNLTNPQITFIPSCYIDAGESFQDYVDLFKHLRVSKFINSKTPRCFVDTLFITMFLSHLDLKIELFCGYFHQKIEHVFFQDFVKKIPKQETFCSVQLVFYIGEGILGTRVLVNLKKDKVYKNFLTVRNEKLFEPGSKILPPVTASYH